MSFSSDEMGELMQRVQELMEASVLAMIVQHPDGGISVTCPPYRRDAVVALLKRYDWASLDGSSQIKMEMEEGPAL